MKFSTRSLAAAAILALAGFASCVNTERENSTSSADPRTQFTPPSGRGVRVSGATVLNTKTVAHPFSDPSVADQFTLQMRGPRVLTSQLHFIVVSSKGDTLHHEVIPARTLLDDPTLRNNQSATARDQEISILRGMNAFFKDDNFAQPAVPTTAQQPAEVDTQAWNSLRTDPKAIGFDYPGAAGTMKRLAYSRQLSRVVVLIDPAL